MKCPVYEMERWNELYPVGRDLIGYGQEEEVWVVLEEDGTEVTNFLIKDLSYATWWCKPLIFQTEQIWSYTIHILKYLYKSPFLTSFNIRTQFYPINVDFYPKNVDFYSLNVAFYPLNVYIYPLNVDIYPLNVDIYPLNVDFYPLRLDISPLNVDFYSLNVDFFRICYFILFDSAVQLKYSGLYSL